MDGACFVQSLCDACVDWCVQSASWKRLLQACSRPSSSPSAHTKEIWQMIVKLFKRLLKEFCVPLLKHSQLTHATVPTVIALLLDLEKAVKGLGSQNISLSPALVSYASYPLLSLLRRNQLSSIPDRVLELLFLNLALLCESWWWTLDTQTWEQLFMLSSSVVGGLSGQGKARIRDDETRTAAVLCLVALTRPRTQEEGSDAASTLERYTTHAGASTFVPVVGQTLSSLLSCTSSEHRPLRSASLQALDSLLDLYAPEDMLPSVLPGVVSSMTRLVLGTSSQKGWENGELVARGLRVTQIAIVRTISDDVCLREGAVKDITALDDLSAFTAGSVEEVERSEAKQPSQTLRTPSWLRGTASQLHIAINTLTPLVSHSNPVALTALASFSASIIAATALTLPTTQPLLTSFLLTLSVSPHTTTSSIASQRLRELLSPQSKVRHALFQTLVQSTRENLSAIPQLILSHADAKVEHVAGQIEALGRLASDSAADASVGSLSSGIGRLLGPMGGVERWGWRLLSALEFAYPATVISEVTMAQRLIGSDVPATLSFPELELRHVATRSTQASLERMFVALGNVAGEEALFAVEWFISLGHQPDGRGISALWCASRVLEGIAGMRLFDPESRCKRHSRNLDKAARGLVSSLSDIWETDASDIEPMQTPSSTEPLESNSLVEHSRGIGLDKSLGVLKHPSSSQEQTRSRQPMLHQAVALQAICVSAGILQARFTPMLLRALYLILHSIVSPISFLSTTGLAALNYIATVASYATPGNMLLSNFDYALDAVSRRLTRERLDLSAMKVLVLLVRLIGPDIVHRAGDLVEECFSRLDEYHGYSVIVDGLIEVLGEVVKVIEQYEEAHVTRDAHGTASFQLPPEDGTQMDDFVQWFNSRNAEPVVDDTDYGPAPRRAWGPSEDEKAAEEKGPQDEGPIDAEKPPTPLQALTKQTVSRSIYFLTHQSPFIRVRILNLLVSAIPVLPENALLPSIHNAWPFILNRFSDTEPYIVTAAAALVEALATHVGSFMHRRVWDDVWPIFRRMLKALEASDAQNAVTRRGAERAGPDSVYAHSFRLYVAMLKTMTASARHVQVQDSLTWEMLLAFRRFLHREAHEQFQSLARKLYCTVAENNWDAVWLALTSTTKRGDGCMSFLRRDDWDIESNMDTILRNV